MTKRAPKPDSSGRTHKSIASSVLGVTRDGVRILKQGKATHFTQKELRQAVRSLNTFKRVG